MASEKLKQAFNIWWASICRQGDPIRRPDLVHEAFEAGWISHANIAPVDAGNEEADFNRRQIEACEAAIAASDYPRRPVNAGEGWQPIETAPQNGERILIGWWNGSWTERCAWWQEDASGSGKWTDLAIDDYGEVQEYIPTHWLPKSALPPLPAAPGEQS